MFDFKEKYKACFNDISGSKELKQKLLKASCEEKRKTRLSYYYRAAAAFAAVLIAVFGIYSFKPEKGADDITEKSKIAISADKKTENPEKTEKSEETEMKSDDNLNKKNEIQKTEENNLKDEKNNLKEEHSEKNEKAIERKTTAENHSFEEKTGEVKKILPETEKPENDEPKKSSSENILAAAGKEIPEKNADANAENIISESAANQAGNSGSEEGLDKMPQAKVGGEADLALFSAAYKPFVPEFYSEGKERTYVSLDEYFKMFGKTPFNAEEKPVYEMCFFERDESNGAEIEYEGFGAFLSTKSFSVMNNGTKIENCDGGVYESNGSVYCFKKTDKYYVFLYSDKLTYGELKKLSESLTK